MTSKPKNKLLGILTQKTAAGLIGGFVAFGTLPFGTLLGASLFPATAQAAGAERSLAAVRQDAGAYLDGLRKTAPPDPKGDDRKLAAKLAEQEGDSAMKAGDVAKGIQAYERAIGFGTTPFNAAMKLSDAWMAAKTPSIQRALQAAFIAEMHANTTAAIGTVYWRLADLYEKDGDKVHLRDALKAIMNRVKDDPKGEAALNTTQRNQLRARFTAVRRDLGLSILSMHVDTENVRPRICALFDDGLNTGDTPAGGKVRFEDFVTVTPAPGELVADADQRNLCLSGLSFGTVYKVKIKEGLPGTDGVVLKTASEATMIIPDRKPTLAFRGNGKLLPRVGSEGIPFTAVNVDRVGVKVYRVVDRALVPFMRDDEAAEETGDWQASMLKDSKGELVWSGEMTVPVVPNKDVVAAIPFKNAVPNPKPGFYAVMIDALGIDRASKGWGMATQWLQVTDIGLSTLSGGDGVNVFARSLSTAKPLPNIAVALMARNNDELARAVTDKNGRVTFPSGLTLGSGGRRPFAVMAYGDAGNGGENSDFVTLNLTQPAFDLSDRGVSGRTQPGPLDAYAYTDRGIYRQGETVNLTVLLRNDKTAAVDNFPLTVKILRPTGTEYLAKVLTTADGGAVTLPVNLTTTAPLGGWRVAVYGDPNLDPIGSARFQVDDFVPEKLAVELEPSAPWLGEGEEPFTLKVMGRFLYGAPAAGLGGTAEMRVEADPAPYPGFTDYSFGLPGESAPGEATSLEFPTADEKGEAAVTVELGQLPDVSLPLRARFQVAMLEPGGRPAKATATYPIRRFPLAIGIKLTDGGNRVKDGKPAAFAVVALGRDGKAVARPGLTWRLTRERADFQWFFEEGRYRYRAVRHDEDVKQGTLSVTAGAPAALNGGELLTGRYRLEVADAKENIASALRFTVGWEPPDEPTDTPDALDIVADKPAYRAGETAKLRISPPFAGQLLLTVATDRLHTVRTLEVPADGITVEIPVDAAAWGPGAYVTATAYRPPEAGKERQPVRAIGLTWLAVDPAERSLKVALSAPAVARPRAAQTVTVKITGEDGKPPSEVTNLTLAAVDEGILRLTRFASPDPGKHFFGKRALGVDIRDDYGKLITPFDGPLGELRQGGDSSGAGLPVLPFRLVSLFQGPVKLNPDGTATVTFDIPDFNGELRLMAVAFSGARVGAAAQPMTVRDPMTAETYFPRFLAPGDSSRVTVTLHNVEGGAGTYNLALATTGPLALQTPDGSAKIVQDVALKPGQRETIAIPLSAGTADGIGHVTMTVNGPNGFSIQRDFDLTIRSPRPVERVYTTVKLAPGQESRFSRTDLGTFRPDSAALSVTFASAPPFDIAGILGALYRYPYGCVEQTISSSLPLLVLERLEKAMGVAKPDRAAEARVQNAITGLLDRQRGDGSFGRWGAYEPEAQPWLTAYAGEFLVRAKQAGRFVPEVPLRQLLKWLEDHAINGGTEWQDLSSRAYALHVLTLAGSATVSPLRYFHDTYIDKLPTALAKAQVGAALARFGDRMRAENAFNQAVAKLSRRYAAYDYGSVVRDAAAVLKLAGEVGMAGPYVDTLLARLPANDTAAQRTTTQEQAWLVLAADALTKDAQPALKLSVSGAVAKGRDPLTVTPDGGQLAAGVKVANAGEAAVWQAVSLSGISVKPPTANQEGLSITRRFTDRQGNPIDPSNIAQNSVFVVILEGKATTGLAHETMITQPLPAGWEIDRALNAEDSGEDGPMHWVGELTDTVRSEKRDDRYNAAVDIPDGKEQGFRIAFTVRAVTPGNYELPGASIEDMYQSRFTARLAWSRTNVGPAQ